MQHPYRGTISMYRSESLYMSVRIEESLSECDFAGAFR